MRRITLVPLAAIVLVACRDSMHKMFRIFVVSLLGLSLTACDDTTLAPEAGDAFEPDAPTPQFSFSDGGHGEVRNPHFFFLPPMLANSTTAGTFDGTFEPVVEICELAGETCAVGALTASFSLTTGTGSEVIRVVSAEEHYIVNWHTDESILDATKVYRIVVKAEMQVLGHADVDVVNGGQGLKNVDTGEFLALKDGRTLPIKFRIEGGALGRIAFAQAGGAEARGIYTMKPDGSDLSQVTDGPDLWPSWSPDGTKIAFNQFVSSGVTHIRVIDVGAAFGTSIEISFGTVSDAVPDWSPDGTMIVFQSGQFNPISGAFTAGADILIVNAATGLLVRNLTNDLTISETSPKWSPDGTKIVFSRHTGTGARQIYVRNADGTGATQLTTTGGIRPAWSPDGTQIAFGRGGSTWVMDADGGNQTDLGASGNTPTWSPGGARIAFTRGSAPAATTDILVMNADGTAVTNLTSRTGNDFFADWGIIR